MSAIIRQPRSMEQRGVRDAFFLKKISRFLLTLASIGKCAPKPLPAERAPASENVGASSFMKSSDVDFFRLIGWKVV
jgi:hypothetical protein